MEGSYLFAWLNSGKDFFSDQAECNSYLCTVPYTLYLQTIVCSVDLGPCNCFKKAPSDFTDLFKSIMGFSDQC